MNANIDPAFAIIHQLRVQTDRIRYDSKNRTGEGKQSKESLFIILDDASHVINTLETPGKEVAEQIVAWLVHETKSGKAINSIHHKVDDICAFVNLIDDQTVIDRLRSITDDELCPPDIKHCARRRYFSSLRSLYRFITGNPNWSDLPAGLKHREKSHPTSKGLPKLALDELIGGIKQATHGLQQCPCTSVTVTDYLVALVVVCAFTGLRIVEALNLNIGDIWITDRLTVIALRKGGKYITTEVPPERNIVPAWALEQLKNLWKVRFDETGGDLHAPFFYGQFFSTLAGANGGNSRSTYQRLRRFLIGIRYEGGPHSFRRYFANMERCNGAPLLEIVNLLGHSTTATAPKSYIQVYPILQAQQLKEWSKTQDVLIIPPELTVAQVAISMNITREGCFRLLNKANSLGIIHQRVSSRTGSMLLEDAIAALKWRIRDTQGTTDGVPNS